MRVRDRITALLCARIEAAAPYREALRRALAVLAKPRNAAAATRLAWRAADAMWRLAGDDTTGFAHYSKRLTLAGVYGSTLLVFLDDESEGGPLSIFESGAILTYLAERSGRFLAPSGHARFKALEWLYWQVGGLGPMLGQLGYFANRAPEQLPLAIDRFKDECGRLIRVMNGRLADADYLAGDYSIADIACYPWMIAATTMLKVPLAGALEHAPAVQSWLDRVGERPAVQRGMAVLQS
jgi:GST-like protein